ncbi:MAG: winged helix-turn-helix domain-containing protein [Acidimicrobiales bacterium]
MSTVVLSVPSASLAAKDVEVDLGAHLVRVGGQPIALPNKELQILSVLLAAAGTIVPQEVLINQVWGPKGAPVKSLEVHVRRLRGRIESDPHHPLYIRTVRGFGYIFDR